MIAHGINVVQHDPENAHETQKLALGSPRLLVLFLALSMCNSPLAALAVTAQLSDILDSILIASDAKVCPGNCTFAMFDCSQGWLGHVPTTHHGKHSVRVFAGGLNNSAILLLAELIFIKYIDISSFADLQNSKMSSTLTLSVECHCTCFITCAVTSASFRSLAAPHSEVYLALSTYWCPPYPCTKRNKHATSTP